VAINYIGINPTLLAWARIRARYSQEELAKKIGTTPEKYEKFEEGKASPTLRQFYKLGKKLNRSAQFFFAEIPPEEPDTLTEMRRLPGSEVGKESPELTYRVSLIIDYRRMALRLFEALHEEIPRIGIHAEIKDNPENVAREIREKLGVSIELQSSWRSDDYLALRTWRAGLEKIGVLVFQIPYVSLSEMRGLSISFDLLPIIGINSKENVAILVFQLLPMLVLYCWVYQNVIPSEGSTVIEL